MRLDRFLAGAGQGVVALAGLALDRGRPGPAQRAVSPQLLGAGDVVEVAPPPLEPSALLAEDIPLDVLYEDEHLVAINKPAGLVIHPAAGNPDGTLVNALLAHCDDLSGVGGVERPGIVHRLDKDTSGCSSWPSTTRRTGRCRWRSAGAPPTSGTSPWCTASPGRRRASSTRRIGCRPVERKRMAVADGRPRAPCGACASASTARLRRVPGSPHPPGAGPGASRPRPGRRPGLRRCKQWRNLADPRRRLPRLSPARRSTPGSSPSPTPRPAPP